MEMNTKGQNNDLWGSTEYSCLILFLLIFFSLQGSMTALSHSDYSFFFFFLPLLSLFFLSFVSPLVTAVGSGVGVQMGCRSTPLPFLSLTPSPLLLPTRLSDALTLPGNKLPVKPTCLRCHSIISLSHCGICSNVGLAEALVGKGKEMMTAFREQGWQAATCSLLGEDAACKWGLKKVDFSRLLHPFKKMAGKMLHSWFPMQNTVAEHFWQVLVALWYQGQDLSIWLYCACGTRVPPDGHIQLRSDFT